MYKIPEDHCLLPDQLHFLNFFSFLYVLLLYIIARAIVFLAIANIWISPVAVYEHVYEYKCCVINGNFAAGVESNVATIYLLTAVHIYNIREQEAQLSLG